MLCKEVGSVIPSEEEFDSIVNIINNRLAYMLLIEKEQKQRIKKGEQDPVLNELREIETQTLTKQGIEQHVLNSKQCCACEVGCCQVVKGHFKRPD